MEQIMEMMAEIIATLKLILAGMEADREERMAHQETTVNAFQEKMDAWIANEEYSKRNDGLPRCNGGQSKENGAKSRRKGGHSGAAGDS
jgi:hypothetical protein